MIRQTDRKSVLRRCCSPQARPPGPVLPRSGRVPLVAAQGEVRDATDPCGGWRHRTKAGLSRKCGSSPKREALRRYSASWPSNASNPSLMTSGTTRRAATGSAHHQPRAAFRTSPMSTVADR